MRVLVPAVALTAICLPLGASAVAANGDAWRCPPSTTIPSTVSAETGSVLLVCKPGRAVVRTANGVAHTLTPSACFIGATGARLHFGSYPWSKNSNRSQTLYIVVERRPNSPTRADITDGGVRLLRPNTHLAVLGTALLRDGLKRGTFTILDHLGGGMKGKIVLTGQWDCGTTRTH